MTPRFAGAVAAFGALGGLLAYWPQLQPMLEWLLVRFGWVVLHPKAQASFGAAALGATVAWFVPHYLPNYEDRDDTRRRMGLYCSALTFVATLALMSWDRAKAAWNPGQLEPHDFVSAAVAGAIGWLLLLGAARLIYSVLPKAKPGSLQ